MPNEMTNIPGRRDALAERIAAVLNERQTIARERRRQERERQELQFQRCQPPARKPRESVTLE